MDHAQFAPAPFDVLRAGAASTPFAWECLMRRMMPTNNVQPQLARGTNTSLRVLCAAWMASTALVTLAPVAGFAGDLIVDGQTITINSPQAFDIVLVGDNAPGRLDIVTGGTLTVSGDFAAGGQSDGADGVATITGGGVVTAQRVFVGADSSAVASGTLTISGSGSRLTSLADVYIGENGNSTSAMTVSDGANATVGGGLLVGARFLSTSTVAVTGSGSSVAVTSDIDVGQDGTGTLTVSNGGKVSGGALDIGRFLVGHGTVTVSGSGSKLTANGNVYVGNAGSGTLTIAAGGVVESTGTAFIGSNASASGTVTVSGSGSKLTTNAIGVGVFGTGTLNVSDRGEVDSGNIVVGGEVGSQGTLTVSGGGVVRSTSGITIASDTNSTGTLNIGAVAGQTAAAAGNVVGAGGGAATIAFGLGTGKIVFNHTDAALDFTANVSGNGDILALSGGTTLSGTVNLGSGRIRVDGGVLQIGGSTTAGTAYIGDAAGSSGTMTVSGSGSTLTTTNNLLVGFDGTGVLNVVNGGQVHDNGILSIGDSSTGRGTVTVSGSGSKLTTTSNAVVGTYGNGALNVSDGGEVVIANSPLTIAGYAAKLGTVTVSGSGSKLTADDVIVGQYGIANVAIADGGVVESNRRVFIGDFAGASGTLTVSGGGSKLTAASNIIVGNNGVGVLTVTDGGQVSAGQDVSIGDTAGSSGTVTVSGSGSTLIANGRVDVGDNGAGTLIVANGGQVSGDRLIIGSLTDGHGTVTVSGSGSKLTVGGPRYDFYVGGRGQGTLTIADGGVVETPGNAFIGAYTTSSGTVTVSGSGSKFTADFGFVVGLLGTGTLAVSNGGEARGGVLLIGGDGGSQGTVTVSGRGSKLTASGPTAVFVADGGTATLTVSNGGVVEAAGTISIAARGGVGTLNIGATAGGAAVAAGNVVGAGGSAANIEFGTGTGAIVFNHTDPNYAFNANISGSGTLSQLAGVTSLTGNLTGFTGTTNVSGGTLSVDTALSGPVNLLAGGTVGGTGTIDDLIVSAGGTLAPGSVVNPLGTLTVTNPLTFAAGSFYSVRLSGETNSFTLANSTADLGGATVKAVFGNTGYVSLTQSYKIFTATGGLTGTFAPVVSSNLANLTPTLSYDANDVFLNLAFGYPTGLNGNQQAVANALTTVFNATGVVPLAWVALDAKGLSQAAGETATGSQQSAFDAMNRFMDLMNDPGAGSRGEEVVSGSPTMAYAGAGRPADAMAAITKAAYKAPPAAVFVPSWKVWAAGFGGSEITDGSAVAGSSKVTSSIYGAAAGADYRLAPDWTAGFALAGGGSSFKVTGSGDGSADLFQAGGFVRHTHGAAYVSASLAYGFQSVTTRRAVLADQLQAKFDTNTVSERIEGGWRLFAPVLGGVGVTPYAAAQVTTTWLPAYAESVLSGAGTFALNYGSKSVTDTQSELGFRTDRSYALVDGAVLTLRGRAAWAHDFNPNRSASATFQALPLASFVVNGAAQASDAALTTASAEVAWASGWSAGLTFDGRFSDVTRSYAGKAVVRRAW